ncbi:monoamine oxidase [Palleronia aestuarii]|uniref:Monoamine oxidase n=1 Tax=Palleronia aestuarii TaxID=568105 RepID=A0A2W7NGZ2_9RHOB|nr:FAD-dependent oxidoreductase [Palleronia aestuarii]PZX15954.1 monoamine oxidase [Palleronia aestuarii]
MLGTLIIGAGFAGLSAAETLEKRGDGSFVVLEARDRVGGRTKRGMLGDLPVDLGGMWMAPSQTELARLAETRRVRTYPTYLDGKAIFQFGGRQRLGQREELGPLLGLRGGIGYLLARRHLGRLMEPLDCARPWAHPDAARLDATTVDSWIRENIGNRLLRSAFRTVTATLFCAEPSQISLLFFLHYLKSAGGLDVLISADEGGAQNLLFHGGLHQLSRMMAADLGQRVHLRSPIDAIEWGPGHVTARSGARSWTARNAIVTVPPTMLDTITFTPELPRAKMALHDRLVMGSALKFWVMYDRPFWREAGLNGTILSDEAPATPIMDVSPPGQKRGLLVGFFDGDEAIRHADMTRRERSRIVIDVLVAHLGEQARTPLAYLDQDWRAEEWSRGCYGAFAPPGVLSSYGAHLSAPVGPIHWAGTETSDVWTGYVEGAIRSGQRAAAEVAAPNALAISA